MVKHEAFEEAMRDPIYPNEISLKKDLSIDDSDYFKLNQDFKTHASKHVDWNIRAAQAAKALAHLKLQLKVLAAEIAQKYRAEYLEREGKPLAVSFNLEKEVLPLNEEWVDLNRKISNAYEELEIARGACQAFEERGYMLREVAKFAELSNLPAPRYMSKVDKLKADAKTMDFE